MEVARGALFETCFESGVSGQVGTVSVMVIDNVGGTVVAASIADIIESPPGSGVYCAQRLAPSTAGHDTIVWSLDGSFDSDSVSIEDLFVGIGTGNFPALVPGTQDAGPVDGPCFGWVAAEDVANCCQVDVGSDFDLFEESASSASQILQRLSGRQWKGVCQRTVRPVLGWPCGVQVLERGHLIGWDEAWNMHVSQVLLPNYPITEILEVKIDGTALTADEYRLDGWRWLTRLADADGTRQFWPGPSRKDMADTEEDTFSITYLHGQNPPQAGIDAAAELACAIYKSCPGNEGVAGCKLPKNTTQVTRAGITISLGALYYDTGARSGQRGWKTGMQNVDLFLNAYNPDGVKQRPLIWSPDAPRFAKEVGTSMGS